MNVIVCCKCSFVASGVWCLPCLLEGRQRSNSANIVGHVEVGVEDAYKTNVEDRFLHDFGGGDANDEIVDEPMGVKPLWWADPCEDDEGNISGASKEVLSRWFEELQLLPGTTHTTDLCGTVESS